MTHNQHDDWSLPAPAWSASGMTPAASPWVPRQPEPGREADDETRGDEASGDEAASGAASVDDAATGEGVVNDANDDGTRDDWAQAGESNVDTDALDAERLADADDAAEQQTIESPVATSEREPAPPPPRAGSEYPLTSAEFDEPHNTFADPTLLAGGRPYGVWVYVLALVLAAAADFSNFYQIIQFAMPTQTDWRLLLIVIGFTACVLFLAHISGVMLRIIRAEETWVPRTFVWLALLIWLGLGICGLYLRLQDKETFTESAPVTVANQPTGLPIVGPTMTPSVAVAPPTAVGPSTTVDPSTLPSGMPEPTVVTTEGEETSEADQSDQVRGGSLIFLGLYLGTGLTAIIGGYLTHNPRLGAYRKAKREFEAVVGPAAEAVYEYEIAKGELELEQLRQQTAERIRRSKEVELESMVDEIKQQARHDIEARAGRPSVTETFASEPDDFGTPEFPDGTQGRPHKKS